MAATLTPQRLTLFVTFLTLFTASVQQAENPVPVPALDAFEQEAVYRALELMSGGVPWRVIFPDDLCASAPHGVVCDVFLGEDSTAAHITELNFGFVSDYNSNPPCAPNATLPSWIFSSFPRLRKLFVFSCFAGESESYVTFPDVPAGCGTELEELVLIDNPSLNGSLGGIVRSLVNLRKLVITGSGFYGGLPDEVGEMGRLEQMTLSGNRLNGVVPGSLTNLTSLRLLDLSRNEFDGPLPESIGQLRGLLKLDLSYNQFAGRIPDQIGDLPELEFLDLSYNRFGNYGIPLFLSKMVKLKEVYLSGNELGGEIPEMWEKLGGLLGLGFSCLGLTGEIPESMAASLKSLSYLGLENNSLEGKMPDGFLAMENLGEINVENNKLSGVIRISPNVTTKRLKLAGNPGLCIDRSLTGNRSMRRDSYSYRHELRACDDVTQLPVSVDVHHYALASASVSDGASPYLLIGLLGLILGLFLQALYS
uniref:Disease resistance R13L4/SHOC-2-like LRR domain-containing protein n=1 Tax=Kalanchoe fedtschenkoi TaxID=63787 RepID=A0A7N0TC75_KALFE